FSGLISLGYGAHTLSATASAEGQTSAPSNSVHITVVPAAPAITSPPDGTTTTNALVTVGGSALPNGSVAIGDGPSLIATTIADGSGNFSAALNLAIGTHTLTATQTAGGETSTPSNSVHVTIQAHVVASQGYWLVAGDGAIFPFGAAAAYGSTGGHGKHAI